MKKVLNQAIDYYKENGILKGIIRKHREKAAKKYLEELERKNYEKEMKKYERSLREEGYEDGHTEGLAIGHAEILTKNVEELMKNLSVDLPRACELLGITSEEYQEAEKQTEFHLPIFG